MKDANKQTNEVIMSREHQALIKFRDLPNLDEDQNIISDEWYNPTLYKYNEFWMVDWIDNIGVSLIVFEDKDICNAIEKAHDWVESEVFKKCY